MCLDPDFLYDVQNLSDSRTCKADIGSELTYFKLLPALGTGYPVVGTGLPGFGCILFSSFFKCMLVKLILAACTECGRPTFSSCRVWEWLRLS